MREHSAFHHALKVLPDLCIGCTHCMRVCPTEAIRVRKGLAEITGDRCVDCGACYKVCPASAIIVEQDDFEMIFDYPVRVALLPSVLIGQFPGHIDSAMIFGSLKELGFTHIYEIDTVVDLVQEGYDSFRKDYTGQQPIISTFCPAVVRLIQVRFPQMTEQLVKVKPPSDIAAIFYRQQLIDSGIKKDEIGIFYVTPCASKIASIKSPVGEDHSEINGVINMEYLYNRMLHLILNKQAEPTAMEDQKLTSRGILWSLTRGETANQPGRSLAVDGIRNVGSFLEELEETGGDNINFLELRACDESCAGGVLISGNRFLTVERLNRRAAKLKNETGVPRIRQTFSMDKYGLEAIPPRSMLALDDDRSLAMVKVQKLEALLKVLPGIDCSACGSPTCRSLAEDVVQGINQLEACVFLQELYIKNGKMTIEEADTINTSIWGENRNNRSQSK